MSESIVYNIVILVVFVIFLYPEIDDDRELLRDRTVMSASRKGLLLARFSVTAAFLVFLLFGDLLGLSDYGMWIAMGFALALVTLRRAISWTSTNPDA